MTPEFSFIDFNLFEIDINNNHCKLPVNESKSIQRHIMVSRYYHVLKIDLTINDMELLTNFHNADYEHTILIQAFYHSNRHYRVYNNNDNNNNLEIDPYLNVYCDTMNSLHVYLLHSHQFGIRIIMNN